MVGTKAFDVAQAERALMRAFWAYGYAGASVAHLEAATGLKRGSLYNAFGDKAAMFARAFARYGEEVEAAMLAHLEREDPAAGAEAMFAALLAGAGAAGPPGCFISRMAAEMGASPGAEGAAVRARLAATEEWIAARLERAAAEGGLDRQADIAALARLLAGAMRAVTLMSGAGQRAAAEAVAVAALDRLRATRR